MKFQWPSRHCSYKLRCVFFIISSYISLEHTHPRKKVENFQTHLTKIKIKPSIAFSSHQITILWFFFYTNLLFKTVHPEVLSFSSLTLSLCYDNIDLIIENKYLKKSHDQKRAHVWVLESQVGKEMSQEFCIKMYVRII